MRLWNDADLLSAYADRQSEEAFGELVERYVALVYSAALRQVQKSHLAEEVAQATFIILAQKARRLNGRTILSGWLCRTAHFVARNTLKAEFRRHYREQEAQMQSLINEPAPETWRQLAPLLDEAVAQLNEADRNAVVLRFYERKPLSEVGDILGVDPDAAQKRVSRALDKLRKIFARHGVNSTTAAIAENISANSIVVPPAMLAKTATAVALAKGATASISILTLIKGALKIMAWTNMKTVIVVGMSVLLAAGTVTVTVSAMKEGDEKVQLQVLKIIQTNSWQAYSDQAELEKLIAIGPKIIPVLSQLIEWRDTSPNHQDKKYWPALPSSVRRQFQNPQERQRMHQNAIEIAYQLGPAVVRPLTSPLCGVLDHESDPNCTTYAMRALYWSIPESAAATDAITNWLSDPTHQHLFGITDGDTLWPDLPNAAPLLAQYLRNPDLARDAAIGLGIIGTNAMETVPELVEVCDRGVAGPPLQLKYHTVYQQSSGEPFLMNRQAVLEALGQIGDTSPAVLAAIERNLVDTNESIQSAALRSLAALHQPFVGRLADLLNTFTPRRSISFQKIIEWTGTLGTEGREALPWLRQFDTLAKVQKLPEGIHDNTGDFVIDPEYFRLSAMVAICRIEPEATRQYLPDLAAQIGRRWEPVEFLLNTNLPKSLVPDIVASLEPVLGDTNEVRAAIAGYVILGLEPEHKRALTTLRNATISDELYNRIIASKWLWQRTGETSAALSLCVEGLASSESFIGQDAAQVLEAMGQGARPDIPALQSTLWHKDRYVREYAGKALRKIAPEGMPPIY